MPFEHFTSGADGAARSGTKEQMSGTDGTLATGIAIRQFSSPVELFNTHDKGKANTDRTSLSAASEADDSNQRFLDDKNLVEQPAVQKQPLGAVPAGFILPMDHHTSNGQFFVEALLSVQLEDSLTVQLSNLAHDHDADLVTALLVAWIIVLSRLAGQETVVLDVCGTFGKGTLMDLQALDVDLTGELDASKLFERVKYNLEVASARQSTGDGLVRLVKNGDGPALSQAGFYSHAGDLAQPFDHHAIMQCLELHLFRNKKDVTMGIRYAADLFNMDTIERYTGYIKTVLMNMATNKGQPVDLFDIISPEEKKLLLQTWNQTDAEYPADRCVHHLFEEQVDNSPHAVAIVHGEKILTYLELNAIANHLVCRLVQAGVKPGDLVALLFERSIELIVTELAVLKVGAAYVPIETRAPAERFAYIISHTGARLLITGEHTSISDQVTIAVLRFDVDEEKIGCEQDMSRTFHCPLPSSLDTAYVMFTSGSTGLPKGVVVSHRAIARAVMNNGFADICPDDCVAFASNPSFDPSTFDIWSSLLNGARVIIIDDDVKLDAHQLATFIVQHRVTCLYLTNPLVTQYAPTIGKNLSQLKYLISGAEQGLIKPYSLILKHGGPVRHVNRYGSTETPVSATVYKATGAIDQLDSLPIGRPSNNSRVYVLDKHRKLVPIGAVGELYIGGPGIATGYLNRPDLTVERFLPDPYSNVQGARMYKSGDLARYLPDGNLVCVGRNDDQVKIRGYRIELGEIQVRLVEHPLVRNATAILTLKGKEKQIVAYVEADHHDHLSETLRDHLAHMLPDYMIPAVFVRLDLMPLTSRGKLDRRALPDPDLNSSVTRAYVSPQGEIETALATMWSELLNVKRVSRHDNFFMLGGHSILAIRLLNAVAAAFGPQLPMSTLFASPTLQSLADAIHICISQGDSHLSIPRISRDGPLELSYAQQRLWFLTKIDGPTENYHIFRAFRLRGALDRVSLQRALDGLYARHESLRSVFPTVNGQPTVQTLPASDGLPMVILDVRQGQEQESFIKQAALQEGVAPFDMERGPLVRAKLIQIAENVHLFLLTLHHIITDGWSMGVMFRDLSKLYDAYSSGLPNPLTPLPIRYSDYAAWQRQQLTLDKLDHQAAYWRKTLAGAPVSIDLPIDRPRPPQQSFAGASVQVRFESHLVCALRALSQKHRVTMFMTVLAAWSAVLSRLSGEDEIVIGVPSSNRSHQQLEQLIGFFISTLALRIDLSEEPSAGQLLKRVRKATMAAQAHQDLPFEQVVEIVQPPRRTDMTPIFQVMFAWQNNDIGKLDLEHVKASVEDTQFSDLKFDLDLELIEQDGEIVGDLKYSTALFDRQTIERHVGYLESMLRWMTNNTEEPVATAPILGTTERELVLETWNNIEQPYPDKTCLHQLFEGQVELSPDAIAIVHDERTVTYRELDTQANRIAHQLLDAGVKPGDYVMLLLDRSVSLVASQIAVLKTGAAYVPIDTLAPVDRQEYIASDCKSTVLLTDELTDVPPEIQAAVLRISTKRPHAEHMHVKFERSSTCSRDTAYVMYTSGSTGRPKGVMVPHRGVVRLAIHNGFATIDSSDRVAFVANPTFDVSTFDVWVPLLNAASIVIIDRETLLDPSRLAVALDHHQVTSLCLTTALLHQYAHVIGPALSRLKYLMGAGEQGLVEAYTEMAKHGGRVSVINMYGPTEASVISTAYPITTTTSQLHRLPIGRPISNTPQYVLDEHLVPVPIGVVGELYIGGPGVANGYLNQPQLTAERFLPDPFAKVQSARMYKTGDLVRYMSDGNLVFVGRNDNQIKIRGFRVELGEIEARLAEHPQVREAVVLALGNSSDDKRLAAYVVAEPHENLVQTLRQYLSVSVPDYMIPSAFVRMDAFPLTNNGKIDRRALPEPKSDSLVTHAYVEPQGELEIALATIWSDLLKVERVSRHDNFFMLGGHSLLAVRLMNRVSSLGAHMSQSTLFSSPTLCSLAEALRGGLDLKAPPPSVIARVARGGPLELSFAQQRLWFLAQMDRLSEVYHVPMASRLHGFLDHVALVRALDTLFQRHESFRTVFMAVDGEPQALLLPPHHIFPLYVHDLCGEHDKEMIAKQLAVQEAKTPFDLEQGPLVRAQLIRLADDEHVFLMTMHHIVTDGWSMGVMIRELNMLYKAYCFELPNPLNPLLVQYPDYAAWQRRHLTEDKLKEQAAYWRKTLAGAPASLELPIDRNQPPQQSHAGASVPVRFDPQLTHAIKCFSQRYEATVFMTVLAGWSAVLSRLSGQDDIVIGTPSANRSHYQVEQLIGFFVSTLALRIDLSEEPSAGQLLERVREATIGAQEHQDLPFEQVVEITQPFRRTDITPIFQVMFAWEDGDSGTLQLHGIEALSEDLHNVSKFELELFLNEQDDEIVGGLNYSTALFDRETIERHVGYLKCMLHWMTNNTEESIGTAPILGMTERKLLLETWNCTEQPYPDNACLHQLFEEQVKASPQAIAIVHDERTLTYRELNSQANKIACQLLDVNVQPGDYVMLLLDRSIALVASQIAVLKVGAVYVPIDTGAPVNRQAYIASDCRSTVLITDESTDVPFEIQATVVRVSTKQMQTEHMQVNLERPATSIHDTAYVMYTSGSTGQPKGVMVSHRGIINLITNSSFVELTSEDTLAFLNNPSFDPSTYDVWAALAHGARIVVIDRDTVLDPCRLAEKLDREQVTIVNTNNGLLHQYAYLIGDVFSRIRYLIGGSEQGSCKAFSAILQKGGPVRLDNQYGPTETTVSATSYTATGVLDHLKRLPIGRPISNTRVYVLDKYHNPVPLGVVGELYIGGHGVANGYLNQPELTAERFLPDPFTSIQGSRMYKTGDLVQYMHDGNLVFVGRNDNQVKIRGFRVELGEIETCLAKHPQVREAVVLALGESGDDKRLAAYVVAEPIDNLVHALRQYLSVSFPEYMIPSAFVRMDAFPLTNNGKIDRRALPEPKSDSLVTHAYVEPQGELEIALATIWSDLLKVERVGRHDNFFMLGGHSLLAVRVIERLRQKGYMLSVRTLFESPTLHSLATCLRKDQDEAAIPPNIISLDTKAITPDLLPLINLTQDDIDHIVHSVPGGVPNIQDIYALSPLQDGILFHHMMATVGDPYLTVVCTAFSDRAVLDCYLAAFQKVVDRHDSLRTAIMWEHLSTPAQVVMHQASLSAIEHSLDPLDGPIVDQLKQIYNPQTYRIDLREAPLVRFAYAQDVDGRWVLIHLLHHLIGDHSTLEVMQEELDVILDGRAESLASPQSIRNLIGQIRLGSSVEEHERFFHNMLQEIDSPSLPYGLSDVHGDGGSSAEYHCMLPQDLNDKLRSHAKRQGVSLASLCHLAWARVIAATSGQSKVVFGTVLFGRMHGGADSDRAMGLFINTLPLRVDVESASVQDSVLKVHTDLAGLLEHEYAALAVAQRCSGVPSGMPLFSAILNYRHNKTPSQSQTMRTGEEITLGHERTNYPVTMSVEDYRSSLGLTAQVVQPYEPSRMCGYMHQALHSLADYLEQSPDTPVQSLSVLPAEEYELVVRTWNNTDAPYPSDQCVHQLFEDQAEKSPDAIALLHDGRSMTYSRLSKCASYLACKLVALGVHPGDYVTILLDRSFELIISQLAILKVGAAYVPIDTRAPVERQAYIMSDCGARLLITDEHTVVPAAFDSSVFRFCLKDANDAQDTLARTQQSSWSSLQTAYVMYTSGSTGRPKGVMVSHRGIVRLAINNGYADIDKDDRIAFVANPAFDHSSYEVWVPLLNGARIIIIDRETLLDPPRLEIALNYHQVTLLFLTTALLHQYVYSIGPALSGLRYLMGAGEQGLVEAYTEVAKHGGRVCVINTYGPTEASVTSTAYLITRTTSQLRRLPIGRPISNTLHYVLDRHQYPVPIGVVGELYIGGHGVANGYLNQPELTAERFLPDPFTSIQGSRMYKTGDLVQYMPDGNLVFVGRNDNQVKIRGFRVELGEIEARLAEHPQVKAAVVLSQGEGDDDKRLTAYVATEPNENLARTLREYLAVSLPEYMIPSAIMRMDAFPLTNNGKIDRRALPEPKSDSFVTHAYVEPQGELEIELAAIWSDLLKIERVGRHDNFFVLGGHSLLAVRMIERLRKSGYTLSLRALFGNPILHSLATCLRKDQAEAAIPPNIISLDTRAITPDLLPLISLTQDDIDHIVHSVPGGVPNIQDIYALSPLQDGILFHHMMATVGDPYLTVVCTAFSDRALLDCYLAAFQKVVDRHDSLRTAIMWEHLSTPAQVVMRQASLSVIEHSLDPLDGPIIDQLKQIYNPQTYRIDLREAPLVRFAYAQDVDGRWVLVHLLHHLTGDHSTLDLMQEEMDAILDGRAESLASPQSIRNLIGQMRLGVSVEEHERFFRNMLQEIDSPSLPYGLSDVHGDGGSSAEYHCMLPQDLNDKLRSHAKRLGVSLASLCHLAWARVIAATSGQSKVVFGTVLFGRMHGGADSDRAMGLFINTLPLRVDVESASVQESVLRVHTDLAGLFEHEYAALAVAQRCSGVPSGMPLFSAILNYRHNKTPSQSQTMRTGEDIALGHERTNYPVTMSVEDYRSSLGLTAQVVQPYEPSRMCGYMHQALRSLADSLGQSPDALVQSLSVLPAEEYELVVRTWNNTDAPYPSDQCVHQLFEDQAEKSPDAIALLHDDCSLTYSRLSKCASYLACKLVALGVHPGDYVAILLDRSFELIISQLAILKVGAAYVPIDTRAPVERQAFVMSDCGSRLLITDEHTVVPAAFDSSVFRFCLKDANDAQDTLARTQQSSWSSLQTAYVMYTSGSTGRPKGVMVPHRGIVRLAINNGYADIGNNDRVAFGGNAAFDLSTFEVWASLLNGASIVIINQTTLLDPLQLAVALDRYQVTLMCLTAALLHPYVKIIGATLSKLRYLKSVGEQGHIQAFTEVVKHGGRVCVLNGYGPTETSAISTVYRVTAATSQLCRLPIGRPISNTPHYVLDEHKCPVPIGVVGELYIGGPGVANGYLNQPELTAERFLPDPFARAQGTRMYRTGDLVRYLPNGNLVFVGRNDNQVKIRGFRVELGEIETRLAEHPQVREAVVLALGESGDDKRLAAYVVAEPIDNLVHTLRQYLSVSLPEYMIPSAFVRMDAFPLTNNGKIDRRALPEPKSDSLVTHAYVEPQGELEIALATIWSDLLKVERVGRHDNFFMLGGHSLLAVRVIERLRRKGYMLSVRTLFESPTLHSLATCLRKDQAEAAIPPNIISLDTKALTPDLLPLISLTQDDIDHIVHSVPGGVPNIQDIYALSPLQDGILFHHMMASAGDPYLTVGFIAFGNRLFLDRYLAAFQKVVDRHDSLRTAIMWEHLSTPAQVVMRQASLSVIEHSLDPLDGPIVDQLKQIYNPQTYRIDLREAPLTRFAYAQDVDGRWVLIHLLHHLIGDHSTLEVMEEEMDAILDGRTESLPAPQSIRNLIGQIRLGISVEEHERFFHNMLQGIDSPSLPYGLSDVYGDGSNSAEYHCMLPQDLNDKLRSHAKRLGVSLASLCHLAWAHVIAATSGQSKVVFGTVLFGRMHGGAGSDRAMGLFINTLPLRVDVESASVQESVLRVHTDLAGLFEHEYAALAVAQRCSGVPSGMPLFSALLNYRHNTAPSESKSKRAGEESISGYERTNYPVALSVEDDGFSLGLTAEVLQPYEPSRMCGYMHRALHKLAKALEQTSVAPVQPLCVLPAEEYELVVRTWNNTGVPYPSDRCVHQLFEEQVELTPELIAIVHDERTLTYRELNSQANKIACQLLDVNVQPGDYVMLLLDRSIALVASQIAVLKIGAVYVPVDTGAPVNRQAYIASDCRSTVLITYESTDVPFEIKATVIRVSTKRMQTEHMQVNLERPATSIHDTAYVMYTSGSTGQPKGVMVSHRGIVNLITNSSFVELTSEDTLAFLNNPSFDPSTYDVWAALAHGARIVVIDRDTALDPCRLAEKLDREQVTIVNTNNGLLHQYAYLIGDVFSRLRYLIGGSEQGSCKAFSAILRKGGPVRLDNQYGPTETTVSATSYTATGVLDHLKRLPIGRPISNTRVYVLDKYHNPVPLGVIGELYIGGHGVANGYLNQPELTAERFLPDPFTSIQGSRMYKTGDLVQYMPDGNLVFVGRNDNQVKIRGFRVELGEIETRLAEHPQVREAVVLALGESGDDKRLAAYVVAEPIDNLVHTLRQYLSASLPEYMIPSAFVRMDAFPLTSNGKIDRRALPEPNSNTLISYNDYEAPEGEDEIALAAIWSDLLKIERVGRHDNFFVLGGHSLLAVRLMNRVTSLGVHMSLSTLFSSPTLCALAEVLKIRGTQERLTPPVIVRVAKGRPLELSFAQQRLWFLCHMEGLSEIYHVPFANRLYGPLNHDALEEALNTLYCRHESLRTVFALVNGQPQVRLLPPNRDLSLNIRDLRGEHDKEAVVKRLVARESGKAFDLQQGPLIRAQLIQIADDEHVFLMTLHHIVTDGWSMSLMIRDLDKLYKAFSFGRTNPLAPLSLQYPDYAAWQRRQLAQDSLRDQAAYWRETLAGAPASLELPTDRPRPPQQSFAGASVPICIDSRLTSALTSLSHKHGVTMFMTTLAAWSAVLSRLSGQDDVVIGTPSANRNHQQIEQLIGFFVSTLALRIDLSKEPNVERLLERVRSTTIAAQAHQDIPFDQVVEIVQPPRRTAMSPLFQVMFAWQDIDDSKLNFPGIEVASEDVDYDFSKFELELYLREQGDEIVGGLNYSTTLFDRETIERHVGYFESMLLWMVNDSEESYSAAPILGTTERKLLLETWNSTEQPYPDNTCLQQLFEDQVKLSPDAIAIVHDEQTLTYRELNSQANWIARQLVDAGTKPGDYVMLLLDRSMALVASQIAVLKIGAAYVPMDTKSPVDRQVYIASDCGSTALITDESTNVSPEVQGFVLRISAKQKMIGHQDAFDHSSGTILDTACVMYTSGSTGQPKGVVVHHRGIARLVFNNGFAEICPTDRMAFTTNPAFDPSTYQVWAPLLHGASIVIIDTETFNDPANLAEAITRHQITCMYMTHGVLHQYAFIIGKALSKLRYLLGGAEQGLISAYTEVLKHGGPVRLVNRYGPTESTVSATAYTATSAVSQLERLPIGRPISNTSVYILDKHLRPVPIGVIGELHIGGPGVSHGYLNRPELTAERFLLDPFAKVQGTRMYKTGDLARYMPDGNLVFVGRNDNQVKIRGFRVELGEIEANLAEHPHVREAVVLALGEGSDEKRLVAYVLAEPQDSLVHTLQQHLSVKLPEYMIPSAFVRLDAFPLTNNGKIDRRALPEPDIDAFVACDYVAPQGEDESALAAIWSDLLKVERVGRHDNFFKLGGHSLLAVRMIHVVRSSLGVDLKLHVLFSAPTVAELAMNFVHGYVRNTQDDEFSVLIPLKTQGCRAPLFCVHSGLGLSWSYRGLVKHLHPEQPLYGLQARGLDGKSPMATSIEEMTLDYIDHIRTIQPQGPYHLLGWSFGGKVAHSIAVELQRQGDCVSLLAIMDTTPEASRNGQAEPSDRINSKDYDELLDDVVGDMPIDDALAFRTSIQPIVFNSARLARSFKPSVYSGDILFFRATIPYQTGEPPIDPACWRPFICGDVKVHDVECTHEDMRTSKNLAVVARIVAAWIEEL
ncbi:unnamed protein product [Mortierella alpina]